MPQSEFPKALARAAGRCDATLTKNRVMPACSPRSRALHVLTLAVSAYAADVAAVPRELLRVVPADTLAVYWLDGPSKNQAELKPPSSLGTAAFLVDQARDWGLLANLDEDARIRLDVFSAIPMILEYPHALMLFDIHAQPRGEDSHRLETLEAGLVLHTKGDNARIEHRIQHLLKSYTNTEDSTLTPREVKGGMVYLLRDRRAEDWAEVGWGKVGDVYIVTIGVGAMDRILAAIDGSHPRMSDDDWFRRSFDTLAGEDSTFALQVRFDHLPGEDDEALARKVERATRALGVAQSERALWTIVQRDRAVVAKGILRREGRDELQWITGDGLPDEALAKIVPPDAPWYAVIRLDPAAFLRGVAQTYVAARSSGRRAKLLERWKVMEEKSGVNVERDLLSRLRPPLISHGFPEHAFGLPLAWTRVIPIDGDPATFRRDLDKVMQAAADLMPEDEVSRLLHDSDGVWHLHFGLEGPAIAVADRHLVISFSPTALRQNLAYLAAHAKDRPTASPSP